MSQNLVQEPPAASTPAEPFESAWDKLDNPDLYDDKGMAKAPPPAEGERPDAPPAKTEAATDAATGAETTAATQTSPTAKPAGTADTATQEGAAAATTTGTGKVTAPPEATAPAVAEEETEESLKAKYSKPEDKTGEEWRMRVYRKGEKLRKKHEPLAERLEKIPGDRAARGLDFIAAFAEPDVPMVEAVAKMTALSQKRYDDFADFIYNEQLNNFPDNVARHLVEDETVTAAELKEGLALLRSGAKAGQETTQPQSATAGAAAATIDHKTLEVPRPAHMDEGEWETFKVDYPGAYEAMQMQLADAQKQQASAAPPPVAGEDPKVKELADKVKSFEDEKRQAQSEAYHERVRTEGTKLHDDAFSVVTDGLRELGLEPDPAKDDERTIQLKTHTTQTILEKIEAELDGPNGPNRTKEDPEGWMDWSLCSPEQKENRKLAVKIMALLADEDYATARDYLDTMRVRYSMVFDRVAAPHIELFNAAMGQQATQPRSAAVNGNTRPEIVNGTSAAGAQTTNKTPWLDPAYRQPGESVGDAMDRYLETHDLPGR